MEQRRRAEAHRQFIKDNPLSPEEIKAKAAASKARREADGVVDRVKGQSNKEYKLQRAAARLARDEEAQEAAINAHRDPNDNGPVKWGRAQGGQEQFRGVPNAYAID